MTELRRFKQSKSDLQRIWLCDDWKIATGLVEVAHQLPHKRCRKREIFGTRQASRQL
jgi:hypothetical protein